MLKAEAEEEWQVVIKQRSPLLSFVHLGDHWLCLCSSCRSGCFATRLCFLGVACASVGRALGHRELLERGPCVGP